MSVTTVEPGRLPTRVGVVVAEFNSAITTKLADGAIEALREAGVPDIAVARVSGALELGIGARGMLAAGCEAVVAVGAVIKGETDHYEYVAGEASAALSRVALDAGLPVGNALLTVRDYDHAVDRSLPGPSNKGREAAEAALVAFRVLSGLGVV
ncbi:MAG: 6,7-dimethyl-8-ribityllumazine synthase [Acidimicrobiia bacterium]|nr:6,7-dimethyl-8-ribityllumazine synthase [Acidimicrobiia bacterium]MDH4306830.1 6,7-dimethyl-8-ribityllumazine synthase [Acidimicrobiia bacterium]MDH5294426.1 6,7-dimethyl-8-ribityllumazine synthase [Acidimicrobiia bacterium]